MATNRTEAGPERMIVALLYYYDQVKRQRPVTGVSGVPLFVCKVSSKGRGVVDPY